MTAPDDKTLLARIASGRPEEVRAALESLYERHAESVFAFARRIVGDEDLASDVMQETFLAAARHADEFRRGSARPWLLTIAANRGRDELVRRRRAQDRERRASVERSGTEPPPSEPPDLEGALEALPATHRTILQLRFVEGLTHAQAAQVLGVSLRTAKDWTRRGLDALRSQLEPPGDLS